MRTRVLACEGCLSARRRASLFGPPLPGRTYRAGVALSSTLLRQPRVPVTDHDRDQRLSRSASAEG